MNDSNSTSRRVQREILPIPDQPYAGFVAYDAKDPDSKFAPIDRCAPHKARLTS
jgi:arylsulfatase